MKIKRVENDKSIQRKRSISMNLYEMWRRICSLFQKPKKVKTGGGKNFKRKQTFFITVMLAIPILNFLVFWLYVNFDSILLAFRNVDMSTGQEYWTFNNFKEVWSLFTNDAENSGMIRFGLNTLKFWLLGTVWTIPHSIFLTYAFHKKMHGRKVFRLLLYIPTIICSVALAGIFEAFINGNGVVGYIATELLEAERIPSWFQEEEYATWTLLFYNFFFGFAGHYILYSGAMANIDTEITEAALIDGCTMWQEIRYICIPLMWPTISMTLITSFGSLFGASGPILLFTSGLRSTWTFGYWIFDQVRVYQSYYIPATLGLCFTCIAFPIAIIVKRIVDNMYTTE